MSEYIKREDVENMLVDADLIFDGEHLGYCTEYVSIDKIPAADVAPVVHGKWIEYPRPHYFKCSNCKYTVPYRKAVSHDGKREYNSCPSCGAKMDLEG